MFISFKKIFVTVAWSSFIISMLAYPVYAADWPHRTTGNAWWCTNCHVTHNTTSGQFTKVKGNSNLCQSCHQSAGDAADKPMLDVHLAEPGTQGVSHRWDSGPGGYVTAALTNTSTGTVLSGVVGGQAGVFSGTVPRTYTITINSGGDVGTATFNWTWQDEGGTSQSGGTGISTGTDIPLIGEIKVTFVNGTTPSFNAGNTWTIKVRPQINFPSNIELAKRMFIGDGAPLDITDIDTRPDYLIPASTYGKASCSTCHNQHNQSNNPFDPFSPTTYTAGDTQDRHFQRINNEQNQLCLDCHSARNKGNDFSNADPDDDVRTWSGNKKSHPVGVDFPSTKPENAALFHTVPKEPSSSLFNPSTDVSGKAALGKATVATNTTCVTGDLRPAVNSNDLEGLVIYFISGSNQGTGKTVTSNTSTQICWATGNLNILVDDKYIVDKDGNPSNNFRFANAGTVSFTGGTVYCMTCHGPHWADSNQDTYDAP